MNLMNFDPNNPASHLMAKERNEVKACMVKSAQCRWILQVVDGFDEQRELRCAAPELIT